MLNAVIMLLFIFISGQCFFIFDPKICKYTSYSEKESDNMLTQNPLVYEKVRSTLVFLDYCGS